VRSFPVVVGGIARKYPSNVRRAQNDHMIQALSTN
jgi:hypothetical protein